LQTIRESVQISWSEKRHTPQIEGDNAIVDPIVLTATFTKGTEESGLLRINGKTSIPKDLCEKSGRSPSKADVIAVD
jgi:hypothetical protein